MLSAQFSLPTNDSIHIVEIETFKIKQGELITVHVINEECTGTTENPDDRYAMLMLQTRNGGPNFSTIPLDLKFEGTQAEDVTIQAKVGEFMTTKGFLSEITIEKGVEIKLAKDSGGCVSAIDLVK